MIIKGRRSFQIPFIFRSVLNYKGDSDPRPWELWQGLSGAAYRVFDVALLTHYISHSENIVFSCRIIVIGKAQFFQMVLPYQHTCI